MVTPSFNLQHSPWYALARFSVLDIWIQISYERVAPPKNESYRYALTWFFLVLACVGAPGHDSTLHVKRALSRPSGKRCAQILAAAMSNTSWEKKRTLHASLNVLTACCYIVILDKWSILSLVPVAVIVPSASPRIRRSIPPQNLRSIPKKILPFEKFYS